MQIWTFLSQVTGLSFLELAGNPAAGLPGKVRIHQAADGTLSIDDQDWMVPGCAKPTDAAIAAALVADEPIGPAQAARRRIIDQACAAVILGGYASKALGAEHRYGSNAVDQANLQADMVLAATMQKPAVIACSADGGATWSAEPHSAAQVGVLFADFVAFRAAQQAKNRSLASAIGAAGSPAAVAAVAWA